MKRPLDFTQRDLESARQDPLAPLMIDIQRKLGEAQDNAFRSFIETIEGLPFALVGIDSVARHGQIVKMECGAGDEPEPWENFFVWKKTHVLAYLIVSGSHTNDKTRATMLDYTLQTLALSPEQWPPGLGEFLK